MKITVNATGSLDTEHLFEAQMQGALLGLKAGLKLMENAAKQRVARGPKTGRIYRRRGIEHQASAPGEPPATDTGELIALIRSDAVMEGGQLVGVLEAQAPHAVHLEHGTRKMAARPFLTPSVEENRERTSQLMRDGAERAGR